MVLCICSVGLFQLGRTWQSSQKIESVIITRTEGTGLTWILAVEPSRVVRKCDQFRSASFQSWVTPVFLVMTQLFKVMETAGSCLVESIYAGRVAKDGAAFGKRS